MNITFASTNRLFAYASMCLLLTLLFIPEFALAEGSSGGDQTGVGDVLCKIVNALTGTIGKAAATIGIVVLGLGLFMGKTSWTLAVVTAIGIGLIFAAPKVVGWLSGGDATDCSAVSSSSSGSDSGSS